jgi:predicted DCC family thiol-disulfide oxidoreductase YuxK
MANANETLIVYDGECIYCKNFVTIVRLQASVGEVVFLNARSEDKRVLNFIKQGYYLNKGMIFYHNKMVFYGAEAVNAIALLSNDTTVYSWVIKRVFRYSRVAKTLYPLLRLGRYLTLRIRRISDISH